MRQLLNTLYVNTPEAYLAADGNNVKVLIDQKCVGEVPLQNFESIVTFGYSGVSPGLMQKCLDQGISISFISKSGYLKGRVVGKPTGNVYLRRIQYRLADTQAASLEISKNFIIGKVYNQRWIVERYIRDHSFQIDADMFKKVSESLKNGIEEIRNAENMDVLRGVEGNLATDYFSIFDQMIINQKEDFFYHGRNRRPPLDRVNALLSLTYTLLGNECASGLIANGLDPYVGFMHVDRPGRESLALDLMEELRGVMADRFVLKLINKKMLHADDFVEKESGAILLKDGARKRVLAEWQNNKVTTIEHPFLKEKIEWGLIPFVQAQLLARYLRGDLDGYPPFLWK
ncbi:type I-C CRISPR-associated endonuclease Cas1c [Lactobacillus delbrueckii subsp. lactis]|uniref:CRISPR-associated endonuclease Cas1 n=2 Tax=Lactobacillus TaxID=1578 RepID=A0ABD4SCN2_9LACO|nr:MULTISPECIES: type I-C CRISPR-associated endonuclease Cas1c [Lactobacillus]APG67114.1 subtype I-C CRISPR-associated endonuclease Cas1 [Lactobacillus delbrueckii subsp. lactis]ARR38316.1 subtype I-C CRISPR-associated endonuclease Cas1 [Lactobacillus delbrueckii subsp. delbrueckii]MBD5836069.1 type I-C CRISPR-associated endonuclease Cas1 [Lactobacillus delbrueckii]MBN6089510.1 type I-C CRISPR-associated endonuclease Cas1 [Lactobacillus delbrueckii subsp. bulgaricus]MCD5490089.1 type I-C CRISP